MKKEKIKQSSNINNKNNVYSMENMIIIDRLLFSVK